MNASIHKLVRPHCNVKLSIITVVKDDKVGLLETMASLESMERSSIEVLVWIHSGSIDFHNHLEIAIGFSDIVLSGADAGIFDAMNKTLSFANGDYILFLNARDTIVKPFSALKLSAPSIVPVQYRDYFDRVRFVKIKKSIKLGIPFCHQGLILPRIGYNFDINYRFGADYLAFLKFDLAWPLPVIHDGLISYDTTGTSSINRWKSDKYTGRIIYKKFGRAYSIIFLAKCIFKLIIKRLYDLFNKLRC